MFLISTFIFLYVGAESGYGGWISTYALATGWDNEAEAALLTSAFWGALTAGRLLAIPMAVRFRPRTILIADLAGCLASISIMILWPNSYTLLWVGSIGLGFSMASVFPTAITLAERRMTITGGISRWFFAGAG